MKWLTNLFFLVSATNIFSCTLNTDDNTDLTNNYILITTAIRTSKASRSELQEKIAIAIDSFSTNDKPSINLEELNLLLETAQKENLKAEALIDGAKEIDSTLRYRAKTYNMFKLLETQYNTVYPEIIKIMSSNVTNKNEAILKIAVPAFNELKIQAKDVINTAGSVVEKYNIKLKQID